MHEVLESFPYVSAIIVFRNEEKYIANCLLSLINQVYPKDKYEIILIDGMSTDRSLELAINIENEFKKYRDHNLPQISYIKNEKMILAAGWNLGIKKAKGEYVFRIDAHGFCDINFIMESVKTIINVPEAGCVGGTIITQATSRKGKLIAKVLSSPFGVGNSKFRYSTKAQFVDTVAFGLYKKEIFNKVGYFDESLKRNQDNDMHMRIREWGYKFFLNPSIKSTYHSRETITGMLNQAYGNGYWNIVTFKKSPKSLSLRHVIPLLFVTSIIFLAFLSLLNPVFLYVLLFEISFHLFLGCIFSIKYSNIWTEVFIIPYIYMILHLSYGFGSLISIIKNGGKK